MAKKQPKEKRVNKSKQQIAAEMKQAEETRELRAFAKEKFYPMLIAHTDSIADAKVFIQVLDTVVKTAFNEGMKTKTVGELGLEDKINSTAPEKQQERYRVTLEMFRDMSIANFVRIVVDLGNAIGGLEQEWTRSAKLTDLKSPFPDEA